MDVEKAVREYIDKTIHLSLGTSKNNLPWVCEVHFVYDQALNLYFRSLTSRRHSQEILENPNVAGNIVKQHDMGEAVVGVYFEGSATRITDEKIRSKLFPLFEKRLGASKEILDEARSEDGHQFYKISVKKWYVFGKFNNESGRKYELQWNNPDK